MRARATTMLAMLAMVVGSLALSGCGESSPSDPSQAATSSGPGGTSPYGNAGGSEGDDAPPKYRIAVIPKGTTHEFWKSIHAGANKAAAELAEAGTPIEIIWQGPIQEDKRADQIQVVETMVSDKVSGIVLAPLDRRALVPSVKQATAAGVPVVIIDSDLDSDTYVSFVATDNKKGGYDGGKALAELLDGKGKVIMLRYQTGSASTEAREAGFMEAIAEYPDIEVVSDNQHGGATVNSAREKSDNLLAQFADDASDSGLSIDGIFCPNESTTVAMALALQERGAAGGVMFVGFDASTQTVKFLDDGDLHAIIVQAPLNMGYQGVLAMVRHLDGGAVEKRIDTGVTTVTNENMSDPAVAELLNPPLDKWLK